MRRPFRIAVAIIEAVRTTVTLDPDVDRLVREVMQRRRITFKEALNEAVRSGLEHKSPSVTRPPGKQFTQRTFRMGHNPAIQLDKALALADTLDDQERRRLLKLGR